MEEGRAPSRRDAPRAHIGPELSFVCPCSAAPLRTRYCYYTQITLHVLPAPPPLPKLIRFLSSSVWKARPPLAPARREPSPHYYSKVLLRNASFPRHPCCCHACAYFHSGCNRVRRCRRIRLTRAATAAAAGGTSSARAVDGQARRHSGRLLPPIIYLPASKPPLLPMSQQTGAPARWQCTSLTTVQRRDPAKPRKSSSEADMRARACRWPQVRPGLGLGCLPCAAAETRACHGKLLLHHATGGGYYWLR